MKMKMLFFAGLMAAATVTFAQADTTGTVDRQKSRTNAQPSPNSSAQPGQSYTKDMTKIKATDVPANLRTTLQGAEYKGWENANIYKSQNGDAYVVEMNTSGKVNAYRFGADGKRMKDQ